MLEDAPAPDASERNENISPSPRSRWLRHGGGSAALGHFLPSRSDTEQPYGDAAGRQRMGWPVLLGSG